MGIHFEKNKQKKGFMSQIRRTWRGAKAKLKS